MRLSSPDRVDRCPCLCLRPADHRADSPAQLTQPPAQPAADAPCSNDGNGRHHYRVIAYLVLVISQPGIVHTAVLILLYLPLALDEEFTQWTSVIWRALCLNGRSWFGGEYCAEVTVL